NFGGSIFQESEPIIGASIHELLPHELTRKIFKIFQHQNNSLDPFEGTLTSSDQLNDAIIDCEFKVTRLNEDECIVLIQDITQRKQYEKHILHDALHDSLTGLANRKLFGDRLNHRFTAAKRYKDFNFVILFLDLDRFKAVNDRLGHDVGDHLLQQVAERLESLLRDSDTLCRWGGDEFVILLHNFRFHDDVEQLASRLIDSLQQAFMIDEHTVYISTSVGIAFSSNEYQAPGDLIRDADTAMYHAKLAGKSCYQVFAADLRSSLA
ncbi:MAG: GGDEF domain-containing protein, partial [Cyanobacteria bacterium P01_H01_bin.121]